MAPALARPTRIRRTDDAMNYLMIYLTLGMVPKVATGFLALDEALALKALIETGGTYTAVLHNSDGSIYTPPV